MFDEYLSIPYKPLGTTRSGCDCWGLVRLILSEKFNIELPKQTDLIKKAMRTGQVGDHNLWANGWKILPDWRQTETSDILRIKSIHLFDDGHEELVSNHIGVVINKNKVMHTGQRTGVVVDKMDTEFFRWRIVRGYRHEK